MSVSVRLLALALRRTLAPGVLLWAALVAVITMTSDSSTSAIALDVGPLVRAGLQRQGLWSGFCLALAPMLVIRAASVIGGWRARGEVDWLGSRATSRSTIAASTVCGELFGAWFLLLAWWVLIVARVPGADASVRLVGSVAAPGGVWVDGAHARSWRVDVPPDARVDGARVRVELGLGAGAGPATEVVLTARGGGEPTIARTHIGTRGTIEIALPAAANTVDLELSVTDPDARVLVLSDAAQLWLPVASASAADRAIVLRVALASCAWIALAFGFGAWISAPSAALAVIALWIAAWLADRPCAWIPGVDLFDALSVVAQGRVPSALDPRAIIGAIAAFVAGVALAVTGLAHWRRET